MADVKTIGGDGEAEQEATLERLLTRLALTDDSKLESVLAKLLPYAISCLSSSRQSTKQKVLDMLSHINKRVKEQLSIKLPLLDLLRLYQSENTTSMVKNFSLVYMEMALDRHSEDRGDLVPELLKNISKTPIQHQDILLRMAMKEIEKYAARNMDESRARSYTFVVSPADRDIFLEFCLQTMIYQPNTSSSEGVSKAPPGLSQLQATRVTGKSPLKADTLLNRKLGLLNVVAELNLPSEVLYPLLIAACSDSNERITKRGEELVKKKAAGVNLEDPTLVRKLFSIFQGTLSKEVAADARVSPANRNLKMRLMSVFTRSITAANSFPATLHCIFDCIYGNESFTRLKQLGLEFTIWTFKHAQDEQLKPMAPIILNSVLKLLDGPAPTEAEPFTKQLRTFAYQVIGLLGQRTPYLIRDSTEIAARLFRAFNTESLSMRFTVQEAATTLASAYKDCSKAVAQQVDALLLTNICAEEGEARFCAVWWAKTIFNFQHCPSRFICMLGTSDERLDVRDMAMEGLVPTKVDNNSKEQYPSLTSMLDFIFEQQPMLSVLGRIGEQDLFFKSKTYISMIDFLLSCYKSGSDSSIFEERFAMLLEHAMASNGSAELHARALSGLLALASNSSQRFVELYCTRIEWLLQFIGHLNMATRESVARLLGIVTSGLSRETAVNLLEDLCSKFRSGKKGRYEDMHGAVCTVGFVLAQCMVGVPTIPSQTLHRSLLALVELGRAGTLGLQGAVVEAIGHVGIRGSIPIFQTTNHGKALSQTSTSESMEAEGEGLNLEDITNLFNDVISSNDTKAIQKAVIAYGHLCYGNPKKEFLDKALGDLFTLTRSKVEEVLFSVGEALCFIWGGLTITADEILKSNFVSLFSASNFLSNHVEKTDSVAESLPLAGEGDEERAVAREAIVHKLFDELLLSGRKEDRCAGAVWLVSIITYCGRHPRVQQMLPQIQEALSHLLGEQNELTQEMASRGMSILYELGDASSKEELVKALVNMLSGTAKRKRAIKLTEDSEVFEEGVLGEKPSGGNITTYKELCNLANEMGQPNLIYKFMDLANHQASMNSKRGAAFGFANIAKQAREALSVYLPSLVPKLIRYQYDPNKQVQDAMGHIWRSIVAEPKKTIDQYFDAIMEDLLLQAGSRLWRSRESSCLALADVLQGRRYHEVEKYLEKIWVTTFRAMDDIKETVRTAGNSLSRSVSSLTLRLGDANLTAEVDAKAAVNIVLPVLLSKGVLSNMVEIRQLSISTVMKLAKTAGNAIRPQLPDLIICMLESLSSLEDQRLNYAELHAEKAGISTDKLESLRISVARDSPMWETLDFCLHQVDTPTLAVLIPRLIQLVRSGVGLNTRVGVAKFISLLSQEIGSDMKQYAGSLLKVLKTAVNEERSSSSRCAFAAACAVIAKHAGPSQTQSLFDETIALYQTGADSAKMTSALLLKELSNQASDVFVNYHSLVLPISFIGRFEEDKTVRSIFEEIWEENTSGQSVSIHLYAADIIPLVLQGLLSTSWKQKLTSAKAIAKLAEGGGDSIVPFVQPLLKGLLDELPSRLWEGKEFLLDAVTAICKNCCNAIPKTSAFSTISTYTVVSAVTMACRKKKTSFRNAAFSCLEQILLEFKDKDLFPEVFPFLLQCCNLSPPSKAKAFPSDESNPDENETENTFVASYENILLCLRSSIATASYSLISAESEAIGMCLVEKLGDFYMWQVKLAAVSAAQAFVEQLKNGKTHEDFEGNVNLKSLETLFLAMVDCVSNTKIAQMRVASLECLVAMLEMDHFRLHLMSTVRETLNRRLLDLSKLEKNASAKSLIQTILTSLQVGTDTTSAS